VIGKSDGENTDFGDSTNVRTNNVAQSESNQKPVPFTKLFENAYDELHTNVESYWDLRLNQQ
jgi:hypothetical protein